MRACWGRTRKGSVLEKKGNAVDTRKPHSAFVRVNSPGLLVPAAVDDHVAPGAGDLDRGDAVPARREVHPERREVPAVRGRAALKDDEKQCFLKTLSLKQ